MCDQSLLLLTLQKLPIALLKGVSVIKKSFMISPAFIARLLGFPTSISTFPRISVLRGARVRFDAKLSFANVLQAIQAGPKNRAELNLNNGEQITNV